MARIEALTDWLLDLVERLKVTFHAPPLAVQQANAKLIFGYFADPLRLGPIGACGIVAQAQGESAFEPTAIGDHDNAVGLFQLWPARRMAIRLGCGINITPQTSIADQCAGIWWELQNPERHALAMIQAAKTPYDAGYAASKYYERSAIASDPDKRGNFAVTWAVTFGVIY